MQERGGAYPISGTRTGIRIPADFSPCVHPISGYTLGMNNTTTPAAKTKTITMTGCNWALQVGEVIVDASRRNGWRGTIIRVLSDVTTQRPSQTDARMVIVRKQRIVVALS